MINYEIKETLIKVENLNVYYGDKQALHNVNFEVKDIVIPGKITGEVIGILGKSGSGKSTLFKALSGFLKLETKEELVKRQEKYEKRLARTPKFLKSFVPPLSKHSNGQIKIGQNQHSVRMGEVGVVPQNYPLLNHRTIYENLEIALRGRADIKTTIKEYSDYFDLFTLLPKYPSEVSGGQRQRAAILQQILAGNTNILLDEPFSGLDCVIKDKVTDLLIKASNITEENTLIIVSHDIESACAIADHVYVIGNDGVNEGSTIIKSYDLLEMDLAYHPDVREMKQFRELISEIKSLM